MRLTVGPHRISVWLGLAVALIICVQAKKSPSQEGKGGHAGSGRWRHVGSWGPWSDWSECSRTCGGGVSVQNRSCSNNPRRNSKHARVRHSLNGTRSRCVGISQRHQLCNTKPCAGKSPADFRREQCGAFDKKQFAGKIYAWEPFYQATAPCALNCRAIGYRFYATLQPQVIDGTHCFDNSPDKICVAGTCKTIGCDGVIGSDKVFDHCGKCGGDNSTCRIVAGLFTRPQLPVGYNLITSIPQGACNINITELKHSKNYLALRQSGGEYIINGDWAINWPGEYAAAGTTFTYQRDDDTSNMAECITAKGPTEKSLDIMMIYKQPNPGIKYRYTLPLRGAPAPNRPTANQVDHPSRPINDAVMSRPRSSALTPLNDKPTELSTSNHVTNPPPPRARKYDGSGRGRSRFRHYVWQVSGFSECSRTCAGGTQTTLLVCVKESSSTVVAEANCDNSIKPQARTVPCNTKPCPPEWVFGEWSECSATCDSGVQTREVVCKQQISISLQKSVSEGACLSLPKQPREQPCNVRPCSVGWRAGKWSRCSTSCGKGIRVRQIQCLGMDDGPLSDNECDPNTRPNTEEVCEVGSCTNAWYFTEWSKEQCSESCGEGLQSRQVHCPISGDNSEGCNPATKPTEARTCPAGEGRGCSGQWFAGPWSGCSSSCGVGVKRREAMCVTRLRGQPRVSLDIHCAAADKPPTEQSCSAPPCGPQWYMTEWTKCSKTCDTGTQTREVKCLNEDQQQSLSCPVESRPNTRQPCNMDDCPHHQSQGDSGCLDKFKNCHLVVQSRLCNYAYYRDACCQACSKYS